jgi:hypothetical protein
MRTRRKETTEEKQDRLYLRQASGEAAVEEYRADERSVRELTVRLRAERMAREAGTPTQSGEADLQRQNRPEER